MIKKLMLKLGLFYEKQCEVEQNGQRFILRSNPVRAEELSTSRASRLMAFHPLAEEQNQYLVEHPRVGEFKALQKVWEKESQ
ncbi:MAG: hypothetical protein HQK55_00540 [Deltaproteobacteria bacterium]|nr:hypothetical protein [Deltaproteobacteria bacterium]